MGLVIDTNVFVDAENGRLDLDGLNAFSGYGDVYIAAITVSELLAGVHLARKANISARQGSGLAHGRGQVLQSTRLLA